MTDKKQTTTPKRDPNPNKHAKPLHEIGYMLDPIEQRLAWAREAVEAGRDVNQLDDAADWRRNLGRPLHAALEHPGCFDDATGKTKDRYESLDLVRFLLDHGADPRLRCCRGQDSPIDVARAQAASNANNARVREFNEKALEMMVESAKIKDGE